MTDGVNPRRNHVESLRSTNVLTTLTMPQAASDARVERSKYGLANCRDRSRVARSALRCRFSAECPPLLHPHELVRKGRYDTILGRAGDGEFVTLRIIWHNFFASSGESGCTWNDEREL